jgi:hypothetical protein
MLAHVHIMKTAGQTFRAILRQSFPGQHCDLIATNVATAADIQWAKRFYTGLKSIAGHCVRPFTDLDDAGLEPRYFTFLRDPIQRCASHYQFSMERKPKRVPFEQWVLRKTNFHTRILSDSEDAGRAIEILEKRIGFVGFVERFNESLVLFERWCGDEQVNIQYRSVNIAPDNRIKQEILGDPRCVALMEECHQADRAVYAYARDVIYARQVKQFGPTLPAKLQELEDSLPGPTILSFKHFAATAKRDMLYKPLTRYVRRAA